MSSRPLKVRKPDHAGQRWQGCVPICESVINPVLVNVLVNIERIDFICSPSIGFIPEGPGCLRSSYEELISENVHVCNSIGGD